MSQVEVLMNKIASLNNTSKELNNSRQINLGRRSTLESQLKKALDAYKETYGIDITEENYEEELNRVVQEKANEVAKLEAIILAIQSGNYNEANKLAGVVSETSTVSSSVSETPVAPAPVTPVSEVPVTPVMDVPVQNTPVTPVHEVPVQNTPVAPVHEVPVTPVMDVPVQNTPVTPPVPPVFNNTVQNAVPNTPVSPVGLGGALSGFQPVGGVSPSQSTPVAPVGLGGALAGFQPIGGVSPSPVTPSVTDFKSILGGTDFDTN